MAADFTSTPKARPLMTHTSSWLELLKTICEIDSTTEEGAQGATQVSAILGDELVKMGFELSWHDSWPSEGKRGRHLIATRNTNRNRHLLLVGHSDTVLSPDEVPIRIDHTTGKLYGAGVCDMKGGDVLMLQAIKQSLAQSAAVNELGLVVLMNCSEETASPSFNKVAIPWGEKAIACLGFEPARQGPGDQQHVVTSRKGIVRFELTCHGKAAHAGSAHHAGVSAIRELARKIEALESLTDYDQDITVNVGKIQGGKAANQIAPLAQADFEMRAFDPQLLAKLKAAASEICSEPTLHSQADAQPTRLVLKELPGFAAWKQSPADAQISSEYIAIAKRHGLEVSAVSSGGASDASQFAEFTPTLDGLGILGGALHSTDEWADMRTFDTRTRIASDVIIQLAEKN